VIYEVSIGLLWDRGSLLRLEKPWLESGSLFRDRGFPLLRSETPFPRYP
jgi:hypothetical protein